MAAECRDGRRKAAGEGDVRGTFQDVAAGIVSPMHQEIGSFHLRGKGAGRGKTFAFRAAEGMGRRIEIGLPKLLAARPVAARQLLFYT